MTYLKEMTNVTSHNYPETMHRSFVINVPAIFTTLWAMAKPIMHPRTVKKVMICKGDYQEKLYAEIPIENLPVRDGRMVIGRRCSEASVAVPRAACAT